MSGKRGGRNPVQDGSGSEREIVVVEVVETVAMMCSVANSKPGHRQDPNPFGKGEGYFMDGHSMLSSKI